jgi:hypothetical protein
VKRRIDRGSFAAQFQVARQSYGSLVRVSCNPQAVFAALRRKRRELRHVQREIEALNIAILLLADDEDELSRAVKTVAARHRSKTFPVQNTSSRFKSV